MGHQALGRALAPQNPEREPQVSDHGCCGNYPLLRFNSTKGMRVWVDVSENNSPYGKLSEGTKLKNKTSVHRNIHGSLISIKREILGQPSLVAVYFRQC